MKKVRTLFCVSIMLASVLDACPQSKVTLDWIKIYGGAENQIPVNIYNGFNNDIVIGGSFQSSGKYEYGMIKTNLDGDSVYGKTLNYNGYSSMLQELIPTLDSGWVFTGNIPGPEPYTGKSDIAIVKITKDDELFLWDRIGVMEESESVSCITELSSGHFVMGGHKWFQESTNDVMLYTLTPMGGLTNILRYQLSLGSDVCWDICNTAGGGFAFTGNAQDDYYYDDAYVYNHNAGADSIWYHTFGHNNNLDEAGKRIRQTSDGGFIVAGEKESQEKDFYVFKTNAEGFKDWDHQTGGTYHESAYSAIETHGGGFAACGNFWDYTWKCMVVRYNQLGDTLWSWKWGSDSESLTARDMIQLADSSFIVTGTIDKGDGNENDIFIARLVEDISLDNTDIARVGLHQIRIFPNPASENTTLRISSIHPEKVFLDLYDNTGNRVMETKEIFLDKGDNEIILNVSGLLPGLYHGRISSFQNKGTALKLLVK